MMPIAEAARQTHDEVNKVVERIARWLERGTGNAALARIRVGHRNALARAVRDGFSES